MKTLAYTLLLSLLAGCAPFMVPEDLLDGDAPKGEMLALYERVVDCMGAPMIAPPRVMLSYDPVMCGKTEAWGCTIRGLSLVMMDVHRLNGSDGALWSHEVVHYIMPGLGEDFPEMERCGGLRFTR